MVVWRITWCSWSSMWSVKNFARSCTKEGWTKIRSPIKCSVLTTITRMLVRYICVKRSSECYDKVCLIYFKKRRPLFSYGVFSLKQQIWSQGDSGGPFIRPTASDTYVQTGVVSFGIGCAFINTPGVYTKVASYNEWISRTTESNDICFCWVKTTDFWISKAIVKYQVLQGLLISIVH